MSAVERSLQSLTQPTPPIVSESEKKQKDNSGKPFEERVKLPTGICQRCVNASLGRGTSKDQHCGHCPCCKE